MSTKRRDNKGRILRDGELQRKDGKYEYRYTDSKGGRHSIYSWRLVETDKTPAGKKITPSLRELSAQIQRDVANGKDFFISLNRTVDDYFVTFMQVKQNLKPTTITNYNVLYRKHIAPVLGHLKVGSIKYSDIISFYSSLLAEEKLKAGSLKIVHNILNQIFKMAARDGAITKNPTTDAITEVCKKHGSAAQPRQPLSIPEQQEFLSYVKTTPKYKRWTPLFTVMLGTGMRVGEIGGLCWEDIDFEENVIHVRRSVGSLENKDHSFFVSTPKTSAGTRIIPMFSEVRSALECERKLQSEANIERFRIGDLSSFVFLSSRNRPITSKFVRGLLQSIVRQHNLSSGTIQLPKFSAHILRHTFCTRLCENESNLKVIQEVMGHSNISITMNIYNKATKEKKLESFAALDGKMNL